MQSRMRPPPGWTEPQSALTSLMQALRIAALGSASASTGTKKPAATTRLIFQDIGTDPD